VLLALQFGISIIAVFFSIAFFLNLRYQENMPMGFDSRGTITIPLKQAAEFEKLNNEIIRHPAVLSTAGSTHHLFAARVHAPVHGKGTIDVNAEILSVGEGYIDAMGLELVEGRNFNRVGSDVKEAAIITENLAHALGWTDATDKVIDINDSTSLRVVGILKDIYNRGVWRPKEPVVLRLATPEQYYHLIVSTTAAQRTGVDQYIAKKWKTLFPERAYRSYTMKEFMNSSTEVNRNIVAIFLFLGFTAIFLSVAGLYSMVSLNIIKRTKEVGIRKVFGASVHQIIWTTNFEFIVILGLSSLAGSWAASTLVVVVMKSMWAYYQPGGTVTFVLAIGMVFTVVLAMIGSKVRNAAAVNPAVSLRSE
jgi:ABC-type antimicrobial peptide transport system permease subunit